MKNEKYRPIARELSDSECDAVSGGELSETAAGHGGVSGPVNYNPNKSSCETNNSEWAEESGPGRMMERGGRVEWVKN